MNNRKENNHSQKYRFLFFIFSCLLLTFCFLFAACGKKGDPTLKSYEKPDPPSGIRAIHRESEIILLWDFSKDKEPEIKGFHLMKLIPPHPPIPPLPSGDERGVKGGRGDFEKIIFLESNQRSYRDTNFTVGAVYQYKIISQSLKDVTSNDSTVIEVKPKSLPAPTVNLSFKIEHDSLTLTWKSAGEGILYNVYRSDKKGIYPLIPVNKEPLKETVFRDNFNINKIVYYTIRSLTGSNIRGEGPASEEITINPSEFVPTAPEALQAVVTRENVYLIWKEPPETWVTGYKVYREMTKEKGFTLIGETTTPSFVDKDNPLAKRNYRVTALGPSKESLPAEIRNVMYKKPK